MSTILFTAVERFDPTCGQKWLDFVAWSRLTQLREVVSLDTMLCPNFFVELTAEDWKHNVQAHLRAHLFYDVDHVIAAIADQPFNVLALAEEPSADDVATFVDPRFAFRGFDLVEEPTGVSALVNCSGFERAYSRADLSEHGLLVDHAAARSVQDCLRTEYPDEPHARCRRWAIWQMVLPRRPDELVEAPA